MVEDPQHRCFAQKCQNLLVNLRLPWLLPEEEIGVSTSGCLSGAPLLPLVLLVGTVPQGPGWGEGLEVPNSSASAGLVVPDSSPAETVLVSASSRDAGLVVPDSSRGAGLVVPDSAPAKGVGVPNSGVGAGMAEVQYKLAGGLGGSSIFQPDGRML